MRICVASAIGVLCLFGGVAAGQVPPNAFVNFEGSQTNPVRLSVDGKTLYAVNTPDARLSVFDVSKPRNPVLVKEIPVGMEPVSVNPRTADEVWVVNQVSDSVSVVSVSRGIVTDTIYAKDEPMDVVFAVGLAFVSVGRSNQINAYDVHTHALVTAIPVFGGNPRAMAVSPDGSKVYAAFAQSGNHTTNIPFPVAPQPPPPVNPALPPAPQQTIIVDAADPNWTSVIHYTMPDNDVVEIDAASKTITRYFSGVGTINLGLALNPITGDIYVANTDALNLVRFDCTAATGCPPNLRGHFINSRITQILYASGKATPFDLNPGIHYSVLPNPAALATALSQPAGTVFDPKGQFMWVAAFGTDRVAQVSTNGTVMSFIEVGKATGSTVDPKLKRGPRGLALNARTASLYVLNRITNTLSVIDTKAEKVVREMPVGSFDPTPTVIRAGRGYLYDAKLSGNGTAACAACHVDGDMDHLDWDLGDPSGSMQTVTSGSKTFEFHPMKGAMMTQTLKGLSGLEPFHWRGDHADFAAFNPAFSDLMGGTALTTPEITAYQNFAYTIQFQPNPNQKLDRTLPTSVGGYSPTVGQTLFTTEPIVAGVTCSSCHILPGVGTNDLIFSAAILQRAQPYKVAGLRDYYQKLLFNDAAGAATIDGFGRMNDGIFGDSGSFTTDPTQNGELNAYLMCFDTGMAPIVGFTRTVTAANVSTKPISLDWALLEARAKAGDSDLIATGTINGQLHGLLYVPTSNQYTADTTGLGPFTHAQVAGLIAAGDTLSFMGVPPGTGARMGIERKMDGVLNGDRR